MVIVMRHETPRGSVASGLISTRSDRRSSIGSCRRASLYCAKSAWPSVSATATEYGRLTCASWYVRGRLFWW